MRKSALNGVVAVALGLLTAQIGWAQGSVTYLSNLGQTPVNSNPVGSDSWLAASFATGTNAGGYLLNSIQVNMADASGGPVGFSAMIYSAVSHGEFIPGVSLATLNGPSDPASAGTYTYASSSSLTLSSASVYFIVMTSATAMANGSFGWDYGSSYSYNSTGGWKAPVGGVGPDNYQSADGVHWSFVGGPPQFAISATAAPEPGVVILLAVGGLLVGVKHRNEKKRS